MTSVTPPASPETIERGRRDRVAGLLFATLVLYGKRGRRLRAWRSKRRRIKLGLARGELIVAFTNEEDARRRALAAIAMAVDRMQRVGKVRRIPVRHAKRRDLPKHDENRRRWAAAPPHEPERFVRRGLTRSYAGVSTEPGLETVVRLALRLAAWRYRLPNSRRGLLVMYSPAVVPAHAPVPVGDIVFSPEYAAAKALVGADKVDSRGVTIMVIDNDPPVLARLDPTVAPRVTIRPPHGPTVDGHATLMTAVVGDIARDAEIVAVALSEPGAEDDGAYALVDVLHEDEDGVDLIVASLTFAEGTKTRAERGRDRSLIDAFTARRYLARRPPALFPTGNLEEHVSVEELGVPGRFEATITIGSAAVGPGGDVMRRSEGSRYGKKDGKAASAWWLAPGGAFRRVSDVDPFVTVNGVANAGTSIANAFAGGLLAGVARRVRQQAPAPTAQLEANVQRIEAKLATTPSAEQSEVMLDTLGTEHAGTVTFDRLVRECARLQRDDMVDGYVSFEHGGGLLRLE
jgi:hypothetical protein